MSQNRIYIIAEAGINHNGSMETARQMIDAAVDFGADAVKFQSFKADLLVQKGLPQETYQRENSGNDESQYDMIKRHEISKNQLAELMQYAENKGIDLLSTPYDKESCDELVQLGFDVIKVASGELTDIPLLEYIARKQKKIILSTGAATMQEVVDAVEAILKINRDLVLLHCTSCYPACFEDVNLNAMKTLMDRFDVPIGYSDHTRGISVSIAAAGLGACVIEKHFTLDRNFPGPDHKASLEPTEFAQMIQGIRQVEQAMGSYEKMPVPAETETITMGRRSILTRTNIQKGQRIVEEMLITKRPASGIAPARMGELIGAVAKHDIEEDSILTFDDIEVM